MDLETSLPLLYPLRYHIDHLAFRSLSTQSASLQSVKFFYEFWRQKYGVSFCYSFYSSDHNPDIAVGEMPAFWMYLENGHNVQSNVLSLTRVTKANSLTHTVRVRAVIHFISFLINTYISPASSMAGVSAPRLYLIISNPSGRSVYQHWQVCKREVKRAENVPVTLSSVQ